MVTDSVITTIPKDATGGKELVVLSREVFEQLLAQAEVLKRSREAKDLKRRGKLPVLLSLRDLRS